MTLRPYEYTRLGLEPFLPPLYSQVRRSLRDEVARRGGGPSILDVGGRKSPYTIGLDAEITILDLPRESDVQKELKLGLNDEVIVQTKRRRSNLKEILLGDMTRSDIPSDSFDIVVSVEVLEHVEEDARFVSEVARVLKPGGAFVMTTPNGDWVENKNPDHKRHYKHSELESLLLESFDEADVRYAVVGGKFRKAGLKPWSVKKPFVTGSSMIGNLVNTFQSSGESVSTMAAGTHHLFAVARKAA